MQLAAAEILVCTLLHCSALRRPCCRRIKEAERDATRAAMMLLLVAGAAALVAPGSRPSGAVACRGAAYDYCVQALGCTEEEATKAEGALIAEQ